MSSIIKVDFDKIRDDYGTIENFCRDNEVSSICQFSRMDLYNLNNTKRNHSKKKLAIKKFLLESGYATKGDKKTFVLKVNIEK